MKPAVDENREPYRPIRRLRAYGFLVEVDGPAVPDATAAPGEGEDSLVGEPSSALERGVVSAATTAGGWSINLPIEACPGHYWVAGQLELLP